MADNDSDEKHGQILGPDATTWTKPENRLLKKEKKSIENGIVALE